MIVAKIKNNDYNTPTSWNDVPFNVGAEAIRLTEPDEVLCLLTGIPKEILDSLKTSSVAQLYHCIKFVEDVSVMDNDTPLDKYSKFDYGSCPYGDTEAVKMILRNNPDKSFTYLAPEIIKKLTGDDISGYAFGEIIGTIGFFLNQWIIFTSSSMSLPDQKLPMSRKWPESKESEGSVVLELG